MTQPTDPPGGLGVTGMPTEKSISTNVHLRPNEPACRLTGQKKFNP